LVASPAITSGNDNMRIRVGNGSVDSGSNYSWTALTGNGTRALSDRGSNQTSILSDYDGYMQTTLGNSTKIIHFQNYSNTTTFKTILSRSSNAPVGTDALVNTWRSTAAINTITLFLNGGIQNFAVGSTFTIYGIAAASVGAKATGGTIYTDSQYYYHVFAGNGTFTPTQSISADVLVVAGGGGGGRRIGGGGGAGGLLAFTNQSLTATNYSVTVGGGGAGGSIADAPGSNGVDSQFAALTLVKGGGGGGFYLVSGSGSVGVNGGSGGGGAADDNVTRAGGSGVSGQGNAGGSGRGPSPWVGGGGGGAGAAGANATTLTGGNGGVGVATYSSWGAATGIGQNVSGTYYLAGGGGGAFVYDTPAGAGGLGGGGRGAEGTATTGVSGLSNTGGGGGGAYFNAGSGSGNGGSGVVIVRYAK